MKGYIESGHSDVKCNVFYIEFVIRLPGLKKWDLSPSQCKTPP